MMKRTLLFGLAAIATLSIAPLSAQQKGGMAEKAIQVPSNANDSTTYLLGMAMQQGLTQYLTQMGVLGDTGEIVTEYGYKLQEETNEAEKAKLQDEMTAKLDSINTANSANLNDFITGFKESFYANKTKKAFNVGVSVAEQVKSSTENFAKDVYVDAKDFDNTVFASAFIGGLLDEQPLLQVEDAQASLEQKIEAAKIRKEKEKEELLKADYQTEITAGEKFLAKNKKKKGVTTLASGLQYKVITKGKGALPAENDIVKVHYKGTLLDGTQFDSSYDRGEPTSLSIGHVIKGWTEALMLMPIGSKWELYIPYDLAYGSRDQGVIKPFSTLIFTVELLDATDPTTVEEEMMQDEE